MAHPENQLHTFWNLTHIINDNDVTSELNSSASVASSKYGTLFVFPICLATMLFTRSLHFPHLLKIKPH